MTQVVNMGGIDNLMATSEEDVQSFDEIIDVRTSSEFTGELGHIENAKLFTLGPELEEYLQNVDKNKKILFICRSGGRSTQACMMAKSHGIEQVTNLAGGMIRWNELGLKKF